MKTLLGGDGSLWLLLKKIVIPILKLSGTWGRLILILKTLLILDKIGYFLDSKIAK